MSLPTFRLPAMYAILFLSFFVSGCWDQNLVERAGFILSSSIDREGDELKVSFASPALETEVKESVEVTTTIAQTPRQGREAIRRVSSKLLLPGKIIVLVIGKKTAKEGIKALMNVVVRDPGSSVTPWVVISEGTGESLISLGRKTKDKPIDGVYLNQLLDVSSKSGATSGTQLWLFWTLLVDQGIDPVASWMKPGTTNAEVIGTALFKDDRLVGTLNNDESILFNWLNDKPVTGRLTIRLQEDTYGNRKSYASFFFPNVKSKIKWKLQDGIPVFHWEISAGAVVEEYTGADLSEGANLLRLEKQVTKSLNENINHVLKKIQNSQSDALGLGLYYRAYFHDRWSEERWKALYRQAKLSASVKCQFTQIGTIH